MDQPISSDNLQAEVVALDRRHSLRPWVYFERQRNDDPLIVKSGQGVWLNDIEGKKYLDAVGGLWCTNIGLGRDEMADAIADQVRELAYSSTFIDMANAPSTLLIAKIAELAPGDLNRVHFTTGGSTAIDSAYRLIHYYHACNAKPEKRHVIARHQSYHGSTYAAMSIGNRSGDRVSEFAYIDDTVHHLTVPDFYRAPAGLTEAEFTASLIAEFEAKIAEIGADKIGGFFAEPLMGSGGVIVPPEGYLKGMWEVCQKHDILFVADEVVTAWGRLGHWFASKDVFDIQPDIICSAKGLSSGYLPIGAMIYSDRIHDVISEGDRYYASGFTYSGHPVCCAAALKNIEIMEREKLPERVLDTGAYFEERLQTLSALPTVGQVRGMKLMMCVENVADKETKELFPDDLNIGKRISDAAERRGLLVRPLGHLNVMSPALTITKEEIDFVVDNLGEAIEEVGRNLR